MFLDTSAFRRNRIKTNEKIRGYKQKKHDNLAKLNIFPPAM